MIETPEIVQTDVQQTAVIHLVIPRAQIQSVMGPAMAEVNSAIDAQGIAPAGPWFSHHLRMHPDTFDFEVGVPVERPVERQGRVQPGELPAATVARTVYRGPYGGLGSAWGEFNKWIEASEYSSNPDLWEVYVTGPESGPDPAHWRTELNRPVQLR